MPSPSDRSSIGQTNLNVTQLSLGTAPIGNLLLEVPDEDAEDAFKAAFNAGVRYLDTAPYYGYGLAENRLGRAIAGQNRDDFVISTKVGRLIRPGHRTGSELYGDNKPYYLANPEMRCVFDYGYEGVMRSHEESLERLGLDRIDILHIHDPDDHFEWAVNGAYKALDRLRSEGTIRAVSAGMNQWEMLSRFMDHGDFDCFLLAGRYSLLEQTALSEFLPKCVERGVSIILGGVFNSGLLADPKPGITFNYEAAPQKLIDQALRIGAVCEGHGVPLKAAALQFPLAHPAVATVLTGVRSAAEFEENERLFRHPIPAAMWQELKTEGLLAEAAPVPGPGQAGIED
ncbi:L-fuco-beta-pyranose dehydrogenase (EC [Olavius algarvensis Delta 1 endosymbiont]|nr:L-fuco-beta-pyranose dehydrogenase (EC [Olavius algarvensis Delta 1 endosymbiont]